jgi:hypothetical protein
MHEEKCISPERPAKRPIEDLIMERPVKKAVMEFQPTKSRFLGNECHPSPGGSTGSENQKPHTPVSPGIASRGEDSGTNALAQLSPLPHMQSDAGPTADENTLRARHSSLLDQDGGDKMTIAHVLTSLQDNKFAVSNI